MSAHSRPASSTILSAPTRPRGGPSFARDNPREAPYGAPRGRGQYHGPPPPRRDPYDVPTGPRGAPDRDRDRDRDSYPPPPRQNQYNNNMDSAPPPRVPFRSNNSSSTTYPRTQRFNTHLTSVPVIVEGGKKAPSGLDPAQEKRLMQLEEDKKRLMDVIEEKQRAKRAGLREWEKSEREAGREALRSELAEGHLGALAGDGGGGAY